MATHFFNPHSGCGQQTLSASLHTSQTFCSAAFRSDGPSGTVGSLGSQSSGRLPVRVSPVSLLVLSGVSVVSKCVWSRRLPALTCSAVQSATASHKQQATQSSWIESEQLIRRHPRETVVAELPTPAASPSVVDSATRPAERHQPLSQADGRVRLDLARAIPGGGGPAIQEGRADDGDDAGRTSRAATRSQCRALTREGNGHKHPVAHVARACQTASCSAC